MKNIEYNRIKKHHKRYIKSRAIQLDNGNIVLFRSNTNSLIDLALMQSEIKTK